MSYNRSGSVPYKANGNVPVSIEEGGVTLSTTDIEVGGVEIKNGTDDTRATVTAANALKVDGSGVTQPVSISGTMPVSGSVSVSNFPATQPVSGTVTASGPLTDTQLRATAVPVSGTVTASGPLTDTQLRASAVPVSGPLTDTQIRATALPVSGTVTASGPLTDTQLRATAVPVSGTVTASGPLTDTQLRASAVPVSAAQATAANLNATVVQATPASLQATVTQLTLTKGTQSATGVSTQDLKDAGRTRVTIGFQSTAPATSDTLLTIVKTSAGVAAGGATSIAVAANKTLRITAITFSVKAAAAAAAFGTLTLRSNPAGATILSSQSELRVDVGNTEAVIGAARAVTVAIPDGIEFKGAETIGVSLAAQATTNVISIALTGFEY